MSNNAMHCQGTSWLESLESFEEPEDDYFKIDDVPLKRRQRRQRLHSLHCYVARSGVVAVAASASMLTRQVQNMAPVEGISHQEDAHGPHDPSITICAIISNVKSSLACTAGGYAARAGELASTLADAIGPPPQRVWEEQDDVPLLLFWAINLCALCSLVSLGLFVFCFYMPVGSVDASAEAEAVDRLQITPPSPLLLNSTGTERVVPEAKKIEGIFRVLGVVSLSLVSGCGLGFRHPIQSALLSGF